MVITIKILFYHETMILTESNGKMTINVIWNFFEITFLPSENEIFGVQMVKQMMTFQVSTIGMRLSEDSMVQTIKASLLYTIGIQLFII